MAVRIRIASPADAAAIHDIYEHYIQHTVATFNEHNRSVEEQADEIAALLEHYPFLIAEDENGVFLGFACGEPFRPQSGYRFTVELTIYLHPCTPKRAGVGSALYDVLLHMLAEQGYHTAVGVLYAGNKESLALHRKFGFKECALLRRFAYKHGQWLDARLMQKALIPCVNAPAEPIPFAVYRRKQSIVEE